MSTESYLTTWTEKVEMDGSESMPQDDGSNKKVLTKRFFKQVDGSDTGAPNALIFDDWNAIDVAAKWSNITAPGSSAFPNIVGAATLPAGADYTPGPAGSWASDSGYVSGAAKVSGILTGYDHVCNSIASFIGGGGHNFIKYHVSGHSVIGGGSYNLVNAGRATICGGNQNVIDDDGDSALYSTIVGGQDNEILDSAFSFIGGGDQHEIDTSDRSTISGGRLNHVDSGSASTIGGGYSNEVLTSPSGTIAGGEDNSIDTSARGTIAGGKNNAISGSSNDSFIGGGLDHTILGATSYGAVVGGHDNELNNADYSTITGGKDNILSGGFSLCHGENNTASHTYTYVFGHDGVSRGSTSFVLSRDMLNEAGDCQLEKYQFGVTTTDTTLTNMTVDASYIDLDDTKVTSGIAKVKVIGMADGSADANNDSDYSIAIFEMEFAFRWDGTNGYLVNDAGTASGPSTSPTMNLNTIKDDITVSAVPHIAINTGLLRPKVTGKTSTTIRWSASIEFSSVMVS